MSSHDAHVLSGRVGSEHRSRKLNYMLDEIDGYVSEARENSTVERIIVKSGTLATDLNFSQSTICRNGFPNFFTRYFDSIRYKENKGLVIECEEYVEERKKQREKIAKLKDDK